MNDLVGRVVTALSGHDKGRRYLVIDEESKAVLLADGKHWRLNKPKRKNKKHIRPMREDFLTDPEAMTDGRLRRWLNAIPDSADNETVS